MAWTAPRTWVVGELVTAAIMNTHIRDNQIYLKSITDTMDTCTHAEPARVKDTIYQNGTKIRIVLVACTIPPATSAEIRIENATPPTIVVATMLGTAQNSATFVVPPNWYYRVFETVAVIAIDEWHEWDLH